LRRDDGTGGGAREFAGKNSAALRRATDPRESAIFTAYLPFIIIIVIVVIVIIIATVSRVRIFENSFYL